MSDGEPFETYHMDYSKGLMVVDCLAAAGEEPDLKDRACLLAVLKNIRKELRVDGIVLNHHREKHYGAATLAALQAVIAISSLFDQLSGQEPLPHFSGLTRKEALERCTPCAFCPANLFRDLEERLIGGLPRVDFPAFAVEMTARAGEMGDHRFTGCRSCIRRSVEDLFFLLGEAGAFADRLAASCNRRGSV